MAEQNQDPEEESLQAPEKLVEGLNRLQKERLFVPPTVDQAVLREARRHLRRLNRSHLRWKPALSWAAMAACLTLAVWLGERFSNPTRMRAFAREDINRDGRVDILDAFALSRWIESGGTLDLRWDINGDGRVDRADVNAIAARAVNLAQAGPALKRTAGLGPHTVGAMTVVARASRPCVGYAIRTGGTPVPLHWECRRRRNFVAPSASRECEWLKGVQTPTAAAREAVILTANTRHAFYRHIPLVRRSPHASRHREGRS